LLGKNSQNQNKSKKNNKRNIFVCFVLRTAHTKHLQVVFLSNRVGGAPTGRTDEIVAS
jgi:hypothetical protein